MGLDMHACVVMSHRVCACRPKPTTQQRSDLLSSCNRRAFAGGDASQSVSVLL